MSPHFLKNRFPCPVLTQYISLVSFDTCRDKKSLVRPSYSVCLYVYIFPYVQLWQFWASSFWNDSILLLVFCLCMILKCIQRWNSEIDNLKHTVCQCQLIYPVTEKVSCRLLTSAEDKMLSMFWKYEKGWEKQISVRLLFSFTFSSSFAFSNAFSWLTKLLSSTCLTFRLISIFTRFNF